MYKKLLFFLEGRDFKILLFFLLALIAIPSIFNGTDQVIVLNVLFSVVFLISCNCLLFDLKIFYWSIFWGGMAILLTWASYFYGSNILKFSQQLTYIVFLFLLLAHILKTLFQRKEIDLNIVFGALSGYIIIGLIGCFMMRSLNILYPDAYTFSTNESLKYYDYIYYSFVNLTTLGFGDILPKKDVAKGLTVIHTLVGQLYMSVIVAIMVGKYSVTPS